MSRLQVGGLALNLNSGDIVKLINFVGVVIFNSVTYQDVWRVRSDKFHVLHDNSLKMEFGVPARELVPLGDKQTQDEFLRKNWICVMKIKLLSFDKYTGLADFEVNEVTCHATVNLEDFVIGEQIIKPHQWYDMNEEYIPKPKWFKRKELFELNDVFEDSFRDFMK